MRISNHQRLRLAPPFFFSQLHLQLPFDVDLVFVPDGPETLADDDAAPRKRAAALSGEGLTQRAREAADAFDRRFARTFAKGMEGAAEVGKAALSNLLGGIGYFYGAPLVQVVREAPPGAQQQQPPPPPQQPPVRGFPSGLFTAVPSRSFFPRGFLWDEGFHQLLVCEWDRKLCTAALASWLDLLNEQGWIPREQILGAEAEARVPAPFVVQRTTTANPPTLLLPLASLARRAFRPSSEGGDADTATFLRAALPRLRAWVAWYERTQRGPVPGSYRWRGREGAPPTELNPKTLTSGLDDYPRASHPSADERHVDLRCWMALAARCVSDIAAAAGNATLAEEAQEHADQLEARESVNSPQVVVLPSFPSHIRVRRFTLETKQHHNPPHQHRTSQR